MTALSDLLNRSNTQGWSGHEIARKAQKKGHQLSKATANNYLNGKHPRRPKLITLEAFAAVLPVTVAAMEKAADLATSRSRWEPNRDHASRLGPESREVLDRLVSLLAREDGTQSGTSIGDVDGPTGEASRVSQLHPAEALDDEVPEDLAARTPGRESAGRRLRREQDEAGETP